MSKLTRLLSPLLSFSAKAHTDLPSSLESSIPLGDALSADAAKREADGFPAVEADSHLALAAPGEQALPLGAVITGYLYCDNKLTGYTYELPSLAEIVEAARKRDLPRVEVIPPIIPLN